MPFGSNNPKVMPQHMVKQHGGLGNHKKVMHTHGAVRGNANSPAAQTGQPNAKHDSRQVAPSAQSIRATKM